MSISDKARKLFVGVIRAVMRPAPTEIIWRFLEAVVHVPRIVGSRASGQLDTGLMPQWRGLLEKYADRKVHYFTLCKSARIGGTMFFGICLIIEKILRWPGPILWLDPTRKTAARVSRQEIQPYLRECKETNALRFEDKQRWQTLEMMFRNCVLSIIGAGSINDLGGRQAELGIINEQDRIPNRDSEGPTPSQEMEARTSQFEHTRKIVRNSTPFLEAGLTWGEFLAGTQTHSYVPCPRCNGYQRLTFSKEPAEPDRWMRIDDDDPMLIGLEIKAADRHGVKLKKDSARDKDLKIKRAADGRGWLVKGVPGTGRIWWPPECKNRRSNRWDADHVARAARYECVHCEQKIRPDELPWMNDRYTLRAHNIFAPRDHVSAHINSLYSPWQSWGQIAKLWILAQGVAAKLRAFWNLVLGLPFSAAPTKLTPKHLELIQAHSPRYERQFPEVLENELKLHVRPVCLTIQADVQQTELWYTVRAWLEDGSRHLIAWGSCGSFAELDRIAGRIWTYDHGEDVHELLRYEEFSCYSASGIPVPATCIVDTGYKAKRQAGVYQFLHDQGGRWLGVRGGAFTALGKEKPITEDTVTFNYPGKGAVDVIVIKQNDFIVQEGFSRYVLKERRPPEYCLPVNLDQALIDHLTSPHLTKRRLGDGRMEDVWNYVCDPHLYDCEKYGEVLGFILEAPLLQKLRAKQDAIRSAVAKKLSTEIRVSAATVPASPGATRGRKA